MRGLIQPTILSLAVLLTTGAANAAGHIEFRGHRYVPSLGGMQGSVGIGFDPINERILSVAETDLCGDNLVNRQGNNGVAWDPVNEEWWMINMDREVYTFDANDQPDILFQIPETFGVPGAGSQTLHRPQGLAVDMNHVYVVDTGENIGETDSNQWFKFQRDGTPVSCSALTDFNANLQPHTDSFGDATVDGIHWNSPGSAVDPGLFYVAVEHTGIMVLDENGMFVDNFLWTEHELVYGEHVPFAFAGITADPVTGDLYLVENAGEFTHVWLRLPDGPQTILHGVVGNRILGPDTRCERPGLFNPVFNFFSLTYRTVDGMLWTNEFNSGDVYRIDPLTRKETLIGNMGVNDVWGMAYDEERDVIYVFEQFPYAIHVLNPTTLNTTLLAASPPQLNELAFNSDDNAIYGVGGFPTAMLYRIDRDTGDATAVGPTIGVFGITYDPHSGTLVGTTQGTLYDIDPATGQASVRANLGGNGSWEGLAAIGAGEVITAAGPVAAPTTATLLLRAAPNPVSARSLLSFDLPRASRVRATVYDLAGRRIATLHDGRMAAGPQSLSWNLHDARGQSVASGMYLIELRTLTTRSVTKLVVSR